MFGVTIGFTKDEEGNYNFGVNYSPVGQVSGSDKKDFYVYEWYIKDTGEIFYVGKGRKDRYKEFHDNAPEAEKIRELYDTDVRFVKKDLTEYESVELESEEMKRILNETDYVLTNRIVPLDADRENYYEKSKCTSPLSFEVAPTIYADEINYHYFNIRERNFDNVEMINLKNVCFKDKYIDEEILSTVYNNNFNEYFDKTTKLLLQNDCNIISTMYSKSVTAWIYCGDEDINSFTTYQKNAEERIGRKIPTYHLIDVLKYLQKNFDNTKKLFIDEWQINPINKRKPLKECHNPIDVFDEKWEELCNKFNEADEQKRLGNYEKAIELLDELRYSGYAEFSLYDMYSMIYGKLKDYDNELDILNEALKVFESRENSGIMTELLLKRAKVYEKKEKEIKMAEIVVLKEEEKRMKKAQKDLEKQKKQEKLVLLKQQRQLNNPPQEGRKILQYDDNGNLIAEYISISEAARKVGSNSKSIRDAANGVQKHAAGYCWRYKD